MSNWTVDLKIWKTTRESEDVGRREDTTDRSRIPQTPHHPDKREKIDLEMTTHDTINLEEVGKDEGLIIYEKVWEASAFTNSIDIPHYFWVGLFLEAISKRQ